MDHELPLSAAIERPSELQLPGENVLPRVQDISRSDGAVVRLAMGDPAHLSKEQLVDLVRALSDRREQQQTRPDEAGEFPEESVSCSS